MDLQILFLFCSGLAFLVGGAEILVRGASNIAAMVGISPLVIGLTVVAYGTSSPELAVNVESSYAGQVDIALGNVVGSNIFNVLFILGVCSLILPLRVASQLIWLDVPLMIAVSALLLVMALDGSISRIDGIILVGCALFYTVFAIRIGRKDSTIVLQEYSRQYGRSVNPRSWPIQALLIVVGFTMLVVGARWLVNGAIEIAKLLGVSELVIGLSIVAAGTSLPEVATSIIAALRGERDIAVGNVVGSNIFNILMVLGLSSIVSPEGIRVARAVLSFDLPVMIAVALACAPIFFTGHAIERWEGAIFLIYYIAYTGYLILSAREHDLLPAFSAVMLQFVLPLTLLTLVIAYVRYAQKRANTAEK